MRRLARFRATQKLLIVPSVSADEVLSSFYFGCCHLLLSRFSLMSSINATVVIEYLTGRLNKELMHIVGRGLSLVFHETFVTVEQRMLPTIAEFRFHRDYLLSEETYGLLKDFCFAYSYHLKFVKSVKIGLSQSRASYAVDKIRLGVVGRLIYCLSFSGCRFDAIEFLIRDDGDYWGFLHATDLDCDIFATLLYRYAKDMKVFSFQANLTRANSLQNNAFDSIVDAVCEMWTDDDGINCSHQRFYLYSDNMLEYVSPESLRNLCCMNFCPGLRSLDIKCYDDACLLKLSDALELEDAACSGKELQLSCLYPSYAVHRIIRQNRTFQRLCITITGDSLLPIGGSSGVPSLWRTAFASCTAEIVFEFQPLQFTVDEISSATDMVHSEFRNNMTLCHFEWNNGVNETVIDPVIQMYVALNKAGRAIITPGHLAGRHPPVADCVEVMSRLGSEYQDVNALYYLLRRHPDTVPST